jgi:hypothetical protein
MQYEIIASHDKQVIKGHTKCPHGALYWQLSYFSNGPSKISVLKVQVQIAGNTRQYFNFQLAQSNPWKIKSGHASAHYALDSVPSGNQWFQGYIS